MIALHPGQTLPLTQAHLSVKLIITCLLYQENQIQQQRSNISIYLADTP